MTWFLSFNINKIHRHNEFTVSGEIILGLLLLISSLPGKARLQECLLTSRGLPRDSTCVLKAEPGKFDIKRREPGILFISLQVDSLFKLSIMMSLSSFLSIQCH